MEAKSKVDLKPYIVNVQGKDFITFPGLLAIAHDKGLTSINTDFVNESLETPVVKATVTLDGKVYTGYGDATSTNVAKKVAGALLRMAETRAIARALRFACNIDMTALEEIGVSDDEVDTPAPARTSFKKPPVVQVTTAEGPITVPNNLPPQQGGNSGTLSIPAGTTTGKVTLSSTTEAPTVVETAKRSFGKRPTQKTEPSFP